MRMSFWRATWFRTPSFKTKEMWKEKGNTLQYCTNWICQIPQVLQPSLIKKHLLTPFPNSPTQKKTCSPSPTQKNAHVSKFQAKLFFSTCVGHNKIEPRFLSNNPTSNPRFLNKKTLGPPVPRLSNSRCSPRYSWAPYPETTLRLRRHPPRRPEDPRVLDPA